MLNLNIQTAKGIVMMTQNVELIKKFHSYLCKVRPVINSVDYKIMATLSFFKFMQAWQHLKVWANLSEPLSLTLKSKWLVEMDQNRLKLSCGQMHEKRPIYFYSVFIFIWVWLFVYMCTYLCQCTSLEYNAFWMDLKKKSRWSQKAWTLGLSLRLRAWVLCLLETFDSLPFTRLSQLDSNTDLDVMSAQ